MVRHPNNTKENTMKSKLLIGGQPLVPQPPVLRERDPGLGSAGVPEMKLEAEPAVLQEIQRQSGPEP